jgi:CubicO group peptidase (beta-lactamase class C family)
MDSMASSPVEERPRAHRLLAPFAVAAVALVAACSDSPTAVVFDGPVDLALEWATAEPEAAGMNGETLERASDRAGAIPQFRSLLVVRRGHLVFERYYHGAARGDVADVRSVTKSVVSTLAGLALERGALSGLDQPIGTILPSGVGSLDEAERRVTIRHLLTMSGGWEWTEVGPVGYNEWIRSGDLIRYLLDRPRAAEPGATFAYNTAAVHLLGVVLEEALGRTLPAFAQEALFTPLGIAVATWEPVGGGRVNGGAGLDLLPRDLARLGQLFLQDGWSGSTRVLPAGWVAEATATRYGWRQNAGPADLSYGYLWWTDPARGAYLAWGYGGQFVYVAPQQALVVVTTTDWRQGVPADISARVLDVIVNGVLPAAKGSGG